MKRILSATVLVLLAIAILSSGCTTAPVSPADSLRDRAEMEFQNNNLHAATTLFKLAQENYTAAPATPLPQRRPGTGP